MTYNSTYTGPQIDAAARRASIIFDDLPAMLADARDYAAHTAGNVFWTADEGFRYRVAASGATNHHLTTAGGVKLYVLPCDNGSYNFGAFNPAADGVTDDHAKLMLAIEAVSAVSRGLGPDGARSELLIPDLTYFIGSTVNIKAEISIVGNYGGVAAPERPKLIFPADTSGIIINRFNTYGVYRIWSNSNEAAILAQTGTYADYHTGSPTVPAVVGDYHVTTDTTVGFRIAASDATDHDEVNAGGVKLYRMAAGAAANLLDAGDGTLLKGLHLFSQEGTDETAHGVWLRGYAHLETVNVQRFPGHGFYIAGGTDGNPHIGVPNLWTAERCSAVANNLSGVYVAGTDANAGIGTMFECTGNGRWGVEDRSFLGCTWIACHSSINGSNTVAPTNIAAYGGLYYQTVPTASAADYVNTQPGTNTTVWHECPISFNNIAWEPDLPEGTYEAGGPFCAPGNNSHAVFLNCYTEEGHGGAFMGQHAQYIGAIVNTMVYGPGTFIKGYFGEVRSPGFRAISRGSGGAFHTEEIQAAIGGNPNGRAILRMKYTGSSDHVLRYHSDKTIVFGTGYSDGSTAIRFSTAESNQTMGRSVNQPDVAMFAKLALGVGTGARQHTNGTAAPTTGEWARGDFVWNRDPIAAGWAGWICVSGGTPGTWKTFGAISP